jgi:hypothetical protein
MKRIILILMLLVFLSGCTMQGKYIHRPGIASLETDKGLYHSGEIINITAGINSPINLENVKVRFYGIYSRVYRLDNTQTVNLSIGKNTASLEYKAPNCFGCSGIRPGTYQISADLIYGNDVLTTEKTDIEIRQ